MSLVSYGLLWFHPNFIVPRPPDRCPLHGQEQHEWGCQLDLTLQDRGSRLFDTDLLNVGLPSTM